MIKSWPVWLAFGVLFLGAFVRGNATYWVGRGLRRGGERTTARTRLTRPGFVRAERVVNRFGAPAVSVGFLTVGFQTAINLTAGMMRMPQSRFLPAVTVGALFWATLYTTVGMTVIEAALGRVPWWWVIAGLSVLVATASIGRRLMSRPVDPAESVEVGEARGGTDLELV